MSYLQCPHCAERIDVFSHGGGRTTAEAMGVHFLGELPLDPQVRIGGDTGAPVALHASAFDALSKEVLARIEAVGLPLGPTVSITD